MATFQKLGCGAIAGALATLPMTGVMGIGKAVGWMVTAPPKQITAEAQEEAGIRTEIGHPSFTVPWLGAHFAFGAVSGAIFAVGRDHLPESPLAAGTIYGVSIWGGRLRRDLARRWFVSQSARRCSREVGGHAGGAYCVWGCAWDRLRQNVVISKVISSGAWCVVTSRASTYRGMTRATQAIDERGRRVARIVDTNR